MRAETTLQNQLSEVEDFLDRRWWKAIWQATSAAGRSRMLQLTRLGRVSSRHTSAKHRIKAMDRLLGSPAVQAASWHFYRALASKLLRSTRTVDLVVDWTQLTGDIHALVAAIPIGGRAVPILCDVHRHAKRPTRAMHRRFLKRLAAVLPQGCIPTLITDAGFQSTWMTDVADRGWRFIARVRHKTNVRPIGGGEWIANKQLHTKATRHPKDLGVFLLVKDKSASRISARLVLARRPAKGRHRLGKSGERLRGGTGIAIRKRQSEPWLLATNSVSTAEDIVARYAQRMQVEETFRDLKCAELGLGLRHSRSRCPNRLSVLLLLGVLALVSAVLAGLATSKSVVRSLQANSSRKTVLSVVQVGLLVCSSPWTPRPRKPAREAAVGRLADLVAKAA